MPKSLFPWVLIVEKFVAAVLVGLAVAVDLGVLQLLVVVVAAAVVVEEEAAVAELPLEPLVADLVAAAVADLAVAVVDRLL